MTNVVFLMSNEGIRGFRITDHTGDADHGQDIVCAAISALGQTAVMGLQDVVGVDCSVEIRDAFLCCELPKKLTNEKWSESQVLLQTLMKGLTAIQAEYPDYLRIREVQSL